MKHGIQFLQSVFAALAVCICVCGCMDADPFGRTDRSIVGEYKLKRFENDRFYITRDGQAESGGGLLGGTVVELGWNSGVLVVKRHSTFRGDADGWMVIDLETDQVTGPLEDEEFLSRFADIKTTDPRSLWNQL